MLYKEWCSKVNSRSGNMVPYSTLELLQKSLSDTGYMGVYSFQKDDAEIIKASGTSKGFGRFTPYSDVVLIDLDNGLEQQPEVERVLNETGLAYTLYSSGGKGIHVEIPQTELIGDVNLPFSQRQFVLSLGLDADESLYQPGRIISMVGRIHPKTKRKKEFIKVVEGEKLNLVLVEKPKSQFNFASIAPEGSLQIGLDLLTRSLTFPPTVGNRHNLIYAIGCDLLRSGLTIDTVQDLIYKVNEQWPEPKPREEIDHALMGSAKTLIGG